MCVLQSRFFSEHGVGERVEAKAKYSSRAAVLYRERLQSMADKSMAQYGTSVLHLDKAGQHTAYLIYHHAQIEFDSQFDQMLQVRVF